MLDKRKFKRLKDIPWFEESCITHFYLANQKRKQLLEMAKNGEPKPHLKKHPLGSVLRNYTNPKNNSYDSNFTKEITELRPDWYINKSDITDQKKQQLLEIAKNSEPRPTRKKHPLGISLCSYTKPKSECYDSIFTNEIKELRPDWFVTRSDIVDQKKQKLLEMARNGESRPNQKTHILGTVLCFYTNPKNELSYDSNFYKEIKKIAPHWFIDQSDIANHKKQKLLEMARNGEPRLNRRKDPLGVVLVNYTNPKTKSYDPVFDKEIRKIAPHWFDIIAQKKKQLLEMVRNGEPKPNYRTHLLGVVLLNYTNPKTKSYDPVFDKEIRKIAPHWFDIIAQKKQQFLEIAKNGEPKPNRSKHRCLYCYTNPKNGSYDPVFDKAIRKLAPHWFKNARQKKTQAA